MWEDGIGPRAAQATEGLRSIRMTLEVLGKAMWAMSSGSPITAG